MREKRTLPYILTLPVIFFLLALLLYPTIYAFVMSLYSTIHGSQEAVFVNFSNFRRLFTREEFWIAGRNTLLFLLGSVGLSFLCGFGIALLLHSVKRGIGIYRTLLILPFGIAPVVAGLTWNMLLNPLYGVVNFLLGLLGIPPQGWTTDLQMALFSVILVDAWQWTPFVMLVLYAGLQVLPKDPYEAATIDGASSLQKLLFVTIPLLRPLIVITLILRTLEAFKAFDVIYALTKGGPGHATETWVIQAYLESFRFHRLESGAALGIIMLLITMVVCQRIVKIVEREE